MSLPRSGGSLGRRRGVVLSSLDEGDIIQRGVKLMFRRSGRRVFSSPWWHDDGMGGWSGMQQNPDLVLSM
jgi:hypothetical protein